MRPVWAAWRSAPHLHSYKLLRPRRDNLASATETDKRVIGEGNAWVPLSVPRCIQAQMEEGIPRVSIDLPLRRCEVSGAALNNNSNRNRG